MRPAALLLLLFAAACRGPAAESADAAAWRVDSVPLLAIGTLEGDSVDQLYEVGDIAELGDGSVVIANQGTSELRIYDAQGRFVRAFGRSGQGPGEFGWLSDVHVRGDTILAFDPRVGRLTRFHASAGYLEDVTLRAGGGMIRSVVGLLPDGAIVAHASTGRVDPADGLSRDSVVLLRFPPGGGAPDTLGTFPGNERELRVEGQRGNLTSVSIRTFDFYRSFHAAVAGDRVLAGPTDSAVVYGFDAAGAAAPALRWGDNPRAIDDAYIEAVIAAQVRAAPDADPLQVRAALEEALRPAARPVYDRLLAGPDGEAWVRRFGEPDGADSEWLVFPGGGADPVRVPVPRERDIRAVGRDRVYTLERDEFDVEYVRAYPLERAPR